MYSCKQVSINNIRITGNNRYHQQFHSSAVWSMLYKLIKGSLKRLQKCMQICIELTVCSTYFQCMYALYAYPLQTNDWCIIHNYWPQTDAAIFINRSNSKRVKLLRFLKKAQCWVICHFGSLLDLFQTDAAIFINRSNSKRVNLLLVLKKSGWYAHLGSVWFCPICAEFSTNVSTGTQNSLLFMHKQGKSADDATLASLFNDFMVS